MVQRLAQNFRTTAWAKHDVIFEEGDDGRELFIVISGSVRLSNAYIDIVKEKGAAFGELSLMTSTEQKRRASASALEEHANTRCARQIALSSGGGLFPS